ncbi:hypothetical protein ACIHDR_42975 [Nocardia sp. NPDC052278]|uniref:hypothetical protein n=1 Tax=unclassified Nocardia TaxID=2637762 RepID=UPI0036B8812D
MPMLPMHQHPLVVAALRMARARYAGHDNQVTGTTALAHAVAVANTIGDHAPGAEPEWIAAALLHRAGEIDPAADGADLDELATGCSPHDVARLMTMLGTAGPITNVITAAEKSVTLTAVLDRAATSGDEASYWADHPELSALISECRRFHSSAATTVPDSLADLLDALITRAEAGRRPQHTDPLSAQSRKTLEHRLFDDRPGGVAPG